MAHIFRVFSHIEGAGPDQPGGVFYIPPQGAGRIDNPAHYQVFYAASTPQAAIAEAFGPRPCFVWTPEILRGHPKVPGSVRTLATFEIENLSMICDLDDPRSLIERSLRPSRVITRDYSVTQRWALEIYREKKWIGLSWWSYYEARWSSVGLWDIRRLRKTGPPTVTPLALSDAAVQEAARVIGRQVT